MVSGKNQQWYYEPDSMHLKHFSSNKCVRAHTSNNYLGMYSCSGSEFSGSEFFVPLTWLPAAYLDKIRVFSDTNKCFDAKPDSNNNVYMADCQKDNLNQVFHYDPRTLSIKHAGLCLDQSDNNNVYLSECHHVSVVCLFCYV